MTKILNPIAAALLLAATAASFAPPAAAQTRAPVAVRAVHFEGTDRNWFNPANWSSGRVPGPNDCVILDGTDNVVIDPALGGGATARAHDMIIIVAAALETLPGSVLETTGITIAPTARLLLRSSADIGGDLIVDDQMVAPRSGSGGGGVWLNPSQQSKTIIVLKSSFTMQMGLGGRTPATSVSSLICRICNANGTGYYSNVTASESMTLAGNLWLNLHYGFKPVRGDHFQIATAPRSSGTFTGLPEGALAACSDDGIGLSITYRGGDGNDVELIAADATREACAAPTVQPLFQIGGKIAIDDPGVAQTREHILLARQIGVP